jgi:hypothetical protein
MKRIVVFLFSLAVCGRGGPVSALAAGLHCHVERAELESTGTAIFLE